MKDRLPISPHVFKQEVYRDDPWKMLMVCMMLNQTSYKQVDKVRDPFFKRFPDARSLATADESDIIEIIRPLGLFNRRAKTWKAFSKGWLEGKDVSKLPGVGKYALDSWKIFQEGDFTVDATDKELVKYLAWARNETNDNHKKRVNEDSIGII